MPVRTSRPTIPADGGTGQNPQTYAGLSALTPGRLYSKNPFFTYRGSGQVAGQVMEPAVLVDPKNSARLLMYFCGQRHGGLGGQISRLTAAATDPTTWTPDGGALPTALVSPGTTGSWDSTYVRCDSVVYDPVADQFNLYYTGNLSTAGDRVGLATSPGADGLTFTKNPGNPIWTPGQVTGLSGVSSVSQLAVYRADATHWYGFYCYRTNSVALPSIRLATSPDGINWTDTGIESWAKGGVGDYDSTYKEWHNIFKMADGTFVLTAECYDGSFWTIGMASSSSLTGSFTKLPKPILRGSGRLGDFDQIHVATGAVYNLNNQWLLYYQGTATNQPYAAGYWSMGMARF